MLHYCSSTKVSVNFPPETQVNPMLRDSLAHPARLALLLAAFFIIYLMSCTVNNGDFMVIRNGLRYMQAAPGSLQKEQPRHKMLR